MSYFLFGSFPQGVEQVLLSSPYNFSNTEYGLFYGAIAIPNLINPIFLGFYIDKRGFNLRVVTFLSFFLIIGLITLIIGSIYVSFWVLFLGNFFLGMTIENLSMLTKKILTIIFNQKKNVLGTGILLFFGRLGLIMSTLLIPFIYDINKKLSDVYIFGGCVAFLTMTAITSIYFLLPNEEVKIEEEMNFKTLKEFFSSLEKSVYLFWIISLLYVAIFYGFFSNANSLLINSMHIDSLTSGYILMFLVATLAIFQLIFSIFMAKIGYLNIFFIFGVFCCIISFVLLIGFFQIEYKYLNICPLFLFGFGYAVVSNYLFSITPILVNEKNYGTGLGILQCVMNFGQLLGPLCFGVIRDLTLDKMSGYWYNFIMQIIISLVCILIALVMFITVDGEKFKGITNKFDLEKKKLLAQ